MTLQTLRVVVLISGHGSNLQALINASQQGTIAIRIVAVISDQADAYGLERARQANIPTHVINRANFQSRRTFEQALSQQIDAYHPHLVALAGFMRPLGSTLVNHYFGRMLNIHPSLLPKHPGLNTHQRALSAGDTTHGASVHFVTPDIDAGPVICQATLKILAHDDSNSLQQRVLQLEHRLYPQVLHWFATNRIELTQEQIILFDGTPLSAPLQLEF